MTETCNCEDIAHIDPANTEEVAYWQDNPAVVRLGTGHLTAPVLTDEDTDRALYVGRICKTCAQTHMKNYLL